MLQLPSKRVFIGNMSYPHNHYMLDKHSYNRLGPKILNKGAISRLRSIFMNDNNDNNNNNNRTLITNIPRNRRMN